MSGYYYKQYKDLYMKAKMTGKYTIHLIDIKNSKSFVTKEYYEIFYANLINFVNKVTADLLQLESQLGRKILHRHCEQNELYENAKIKDKVVLLKSQFDIIPKNSLFREDQRNPNCWLNDQIYFIIERDSLSEKQMLNIIQKEKNDIVPNYDMHYMYAHYDNDETAFSNEFTRTYCIAVLDELAKEQGMTLTSPTKNETTL